MPHKQAYSKKTDCPFRIEAKKIYLQNMEEINHNSFSQFLPNPYAFATWIPILIFASFVLLFSTNIPWYDDFPQHSEKSNAEKIPLSPD